MRVRRWPDWPAGPPVLLRQGWGFRFACPQGAL
nr:MAG TPA: hypothetical protein [Caudoviricetes sp.]